jgi:plasmid stability protein
VAILHVRNVPDDLHDRIKKLAHKERRSLGAEVVILLERGLEGNQEAGGPRQVTTAEILEDMRRDREAWQLPKGAPDSVQLIRESRGPLE